MLVGVPASGDVHNIPEHSVTLLEVLDSTADLSYLTSNIGSKDERVVLDVEAGILDFPAGTLVLSRHIEGKLIPVHWVYRESLVLDDDILLSSLRVRCLFDLERLVLGGLALLLVVVLSCILEKPTMMYAAELEGMRGSVIEGI